MPRERCALGALVALAVACYAAIGLTSHRWQSRWAKVLDYLVMLPRGMPGLVAGLAFLWLFLFVKPLARRSSARPAACAAAADVPDVAA